MKAKLESTNQIVTIDVPDGQIQGRIWDGVTEAGIYVQCIIVRLAAPADADQRQFQRELHQCRQPEPGEMVFPLRMVI